MNRIGKYEGVVRLVLLLVVLPAVVYRLSLGHTVALWGEVRRTLLYNRMRLSSCSIRWN